MNRSLLFVAPNLPDAGFGGSRMRNYHLLKQLATHFDVTLLVLKEPELDTQRLAGLPLKRVRIVSAQGRSSFSRFVFACRYPEWTQTYDSEEIENAIDEELAQDYDLIHVSHSYLAPYFLDYARKKRILIDHHNVKSSLFASALKHAHGLKRIKYHMEKVRWRWMETEVLGQFRLHNACSVDEQMTLQEKLNLKVALVPTVIETNRRPRPVEEDVNRLVFAGDLSYFPNEDALTYFIKDILPLIRQGRLETTLKVVGRRPEKTLRNLLYQTPEVDYAYDVDDTLPYLARAAVVVIPLRIGGGTRLKVMEAMAAGKPVVATAKATEGLDVGEAEGVFIADSPREFAERTLGLLKNDAQRRRSGEQARIAAERFDWRIQVSSTCALYETYASSPWESLSGRPRSPAGPLIR